MQKNTSRLISVLRIILLLLIIAIHSPHNDSVLTEWFVAFVANAAVPMFFIISGFLFAGSKTYFAENIKKRVYSLLIPFFLWMFVGLIFTECKIALGFASFENVFAKANVAEKIMMASGLFDSIPVLDGPMWYIRNLFCACCLFPIILKILRSVPRPFMAICLFCYLFKINNFFYTTVQTLAFFPIGVYLSIYKFDIPSLFSKKAALISVLTAMALTFLWYSFRGYYAAYMFSQLGSLCFIYLIAHLLFILISCTKIHIEKESIFLRSAFFVYASHIMFIPFFEKLVFVYLKTENAFIIPLNYALFVLSIYVFSLASFAVLERVLPDKIWQPLNGNRA